MTEFSKVLIVDDDVVSRKMLASTLENMGYATIQCSNGRLAWESLYENQDVCLMITDMMMPDMDGRELVSIVRGNQSFAALPIVIVSGIVSAEEVQNLLKMGPCRFSAKPLNMAQIKDYVKTLVPKEKQPKIS